MASALVVLFILCFIVMLAYAIFGTLNEPDPIEDGAEALSGPKDIYILPPPTGPTWEDIRMERELQFAEETKRCQYCGCWYKKQRLGSALCTQCGAPLL